MRETLRTRLHRLMFNLIPAYRGTGGRVSYIAGDYREFRVVLPLSWRTRNLYGTIFGGSLYGAIDPIYAYMLFRALGPEYVVWDKAATIRFRRPGRSRLHAQFLLDDRELKLIRTQLAEARPVTRCYTVELVDDAGVVHATAEKTIYIARREAA
jgi:acyl-coenzyme A thioesterase PaaI-like protein